MDSSNRPSDSPDSSFFDHFTTKIDCEYTSDDDEFDNDGHNMGGAVVKSSPTTSQRDSLRKVQSASYSRETMRSTTGTMSMDVSVSINDHTARPDFRQFGRSMSEISERQKDKARDLAAPAIPEYSPRYQKNSNSSNSNAESSQHSSHSCGVAESDAATSHLASPPTDFKPGGINLGAKFGLAHLTIPHNHSTNSIGSIFSEAASALDDLCLSREHSAPTRSPLNASAGTADAHATPLPTSKSKPRVCCVFDFDCTLSSSHVYHFINYHRKFLADFHNPSVSRREKSLIEMKKRLQQLVKNGGNCSNFNASASGHKVTFVCEADADCSSRTIHRSDSTFLDVPSSSVRLSSPTSSQKTSGLGQSLSRSSSQEQTVAWTEKDHEDYKHKLKTISDKLKHTRALTEEERDMFIEEAFDGEERLRVLREFLEDLKMNKHFKLLIASKGDKRHILHCLKIVELDCFFDEKHVFDFATHKADLLMKLFQKKYHVLYFDDTPDDHRSLYQRVNLMKLHEKCSENFDVYESHVGTHYVYCKTLATNGFGISNALVQAFHTDMEQHHWFDLVA